MGYLKKDAIELAPVAQKFFFDLREKSDFDFDKASKAERKKHMRKLMEMAWEATNDLLNTAQEMTFPYPKNGML